MSGDIFGLEEMKKQVIEIGNSNYSNILDLIDLIISMNFIVIETEMSYASEFNKKAMDLYIDMKNELFKMLEIDIDYYWNK